jgi:hypothetical protein
MGQFNPLRQEVPFRNAKTYRYYSLPKEHTSFFSEWWMVVTPVPKDNGPLPLSSYFVWSPGMLVNHYSTSRPRRTQQETILNHACIVSLGFKGKQPSALLYSLEHKKMYPEPINLTKLDPSPLGQMVFAEIVRSYVETRGNTL